MRMALGATSGRVQRAVLAQTLRLALIGLAAGTLASLGAAHLIASLLFATSPWDPVAYAAMATFLWALPCSAGISPRAGPRGFIR